ncbi:hypothetical protein NE662_10480, partial [Bifidobacterium pseudocatenulatum]|uniref:hypothetical protein n=1 Tax=Bifidobacterium pseudocatenulatum TaxID=28026 RepID=UPI00210A1E9D
PAVVASVADPAADLRSVRRSSVSRLGILVESRPPFAGDDEEITAKVAQEKGCAAASSAEWRRLEKI